MYSSIKRYLLVLGITCFVFLLFIKESKAAHSPYDITQDFSKTIIALSDPETGIPPSHIGHPGFNSLTFLYDVSVNAMMLKMSGHQTEAERIMDYFVTRLTTPVQQILADEDSNNVLGVLKVISPDAKTLGLVNAFNLHSPETIGEGQLEFFTTPGPISFMVMAFLQINREKYLPQAIQLGNALLSMQHEDGGIYDGDRSAFNVYTEPHSDAINAFFQLYDATKDVSWKKAGDRAIRWFKKNVYKSATAEIYQGVWEYGPNKIFATDAYSWVMAGVLGDIFSVDELEALTSTMLNRCLSQVTVELPGNHVQTMIMADFTDSRDQNIIERRGGFHPMGSPEWSGGVILALQKNAVRLWEKGATDKAKAYKAMAEYLMSEVLKSKYRVNGLMMFPYATGQGVEVGHGWRTPYFYVQGLVEHLAGGSLVGGWPIMPMNGFNPFILNDHYFAAYKKIDISDEDHQQAFNYIAGIVAKHRFTEPIVTQSIDSRTQIVEPRKYNTIAWKAFEAQNYVEAINWAKKVVENQKWVELAQYEEKLKMKRVGGIIDYPWGTTYKNNDSPILYEIMKYPLLNEVATSMWILANSEYELNNIDEAEYWIKRIIYDLPLHQIAHTIPTPDTAQGFLIDGYWNAIVSWIYNPSQSGRDQAIDQLINKMGLQVTAPLTVSIDSASLGKG